MKGKHCKLLSVFTVKDDSLSYAADTSNRASKKDARAVVKFQSREINILVKYYGTELRDVIIFAKHKSSLASNWKGQTGIQRSMYCYSLQIYVGKACHVDGKYYHFCFH